MSISPEQASTQEISTPQSKSSTSTSLLKNLEILAQLQLYDKLNTNDEILYIDAGYMLQCLVRYYYGCNRSNTIKRLGDICTEIETFFSSNEISSSTIRELITPPVFPGNSKNMRAKKLKYRAKIRSIPVEVQEMGKKLLAILPGVIVGLNNLSETYSVDGTTRDGISSIIKRIEAVLV